MRTGRKSACWLSDDMAHALAASCPPLQTAEVLRAADRLSQPAATESILGIDSMFRSGMDRVRLQNVIEALHALYDRPRAFPRPIR
jgi:hypothetical protein